MYKKALTVAVAATALTPLAAVPASAAVSASAAPTVEVHSGLPITIDEPDSLFTCPGGQVMTGRSHKGNEDGRTTYWCGRALAPGRHVLADLHITRETAMPSSGGQRDVSAVRDGSAVLPCAVAYDQACGGEEQEDQHNVRKVHHARPLPRWRVVSHA